VLMLQAAARRQKAQDIGKSKRKHVDWAAMTIQGNWRRHKKKQKRAAQRAVDEARARLLGAQQAEAAAAAKASPGVITRLSRSLSFTKRNKGKGDSGSTPRAGEEAAPLDKLPTPVLSGASTTASSEASPTTPAEPTPTTKKRTLSFTRRQKKSTPSDVEEPKQAL